MAGVLSQMVLNAYHAKHGYGILLSVPIETEL